MFAELTPNRRSFLLAALLAAALAEQNLVAADVNRCQVKILPDGLNAEFKLWFDSPPQFVASTVNPPPTGVVPRQVDSYQFFINYDPLLSYTTNMMKTNVTIIRGEESQFSTSVPPIIPIRRLPQVAPTSDWTAGGWGALCGEVAYSLNGSEKRVDFTVLLAKIAAASTGFTYRLEWYTNGVCRGWTNGVSQ